MQGADVGEGVPNAAGGQRMVVLLLLDAGGLDLIGQGVEFLVA